MNHEQLERLRRELQLSIEVDHSGWLQEPMDIRFILGPGRTLCPTTIRVRASDQMAACVADANILDRCNRYNHCIDELRRLRARCSQAVSKEHGKLDLQSPLMIAFTKLQNLDHELVQRQAQYMGNNTVTPKTLASEIWFLENLLNELGAPVKQAEDLELQKLYDADTLDHSLEP